MTASVLVIGQRNPMCSVLLLIVSFCALSGLYVLLGSPFVAVIQIIIYAGAIMVLFLFVVMLLNVPTEEEPTGRDAAAAGRRRAAPVRRRAVGAAGGRTVLGARARCGRSAMPASDVPRDHRKDIGLRLFQDYAFAFEATSRADPGGDGRGRHPRPEGAALGDAARTDAQLLSDALGGAVCDRHGGRVPAPQHHHDPAVGGSDAERGQPDVRRRGPVPRTWWTARSSCSSS